MAPLSCACMFRTCLVYDPGSAATQVVNARRLCAKLCTQAGRSVVGWEGNALGAGGFGHLLVETNYVCTPPEVNEAGLLKMVGFLPFLMRVGWSLWDFICLWSETTFSNAP